MPAPPRTQFPEGLWGTIRWFLVQSRDKRFLVSALSAISALALLILGTLFLLHKVGYSVKVSWLQYRDGEAQVVGLGTGGHLRDAIDLGRDKKKPQPNIIISATYFVRVEDGPDRERGAPFIMRTLSERVFYTLLALRNIDPDERIFNEAFQNPTADEMHYWRGTDAEDNRLGGSGKGDFANYDVRFKIPKGDVHSLTTGVDEVIRLPMADKRQYRGTELSSEEDVASYPNKEDVIADLTIIIESSSIHLHAKDAFLSEGADSSAVNSQRVSVAQNDTLGTSSSSLPGLSTISARWENVKPGQNAILRYGWQKHVPR